MLFSLLAETCSISLNVPNSAEVVFMPADKLETGTVFIVFCQAGYLADITYGTMSCNKEGIWDNAPMCNKKPLMTTATPKPIYHCTTSIKVDNAASVTFIPENEPKSGTAFVAFCKSGYYPVKVFGIMQCNEEGFWINAPECTVKMTTKLMPHSTEPTYPTTTTTDSISGDSDDGKLYIVACQRGGVSDEPPWLRAASRHKPGILVINHQKLKKNGPTFGPVLLRLGEPGSHNINESGQIIFHTNFEMGSDFRYLEHWHISHLHVILVCQ